MNLLFLQVIIIFDIGFHLIHAQNPINKVNHTICFDVVGCFSNERPFEKIGIFVESDPEYLKTEFSLFINESENEPITYKDISTIRNSKFNKNLPLKIIVHGYSDSISSKWINDMKRELFTLDKFNILIVNWKNGAEYNKYRFAAANIRIVGKELSLIINQLTNEFYPTTSNKFSIHCIGHSLGAHLCGHASEDSTVYFDRITGLDPANEYFENTFRTVRVDPIDAKFVDIIHTDTGSEKDGHFGIIMSTGFVDFYPNGGNNQPGCDSTQSGSNPTSEKGCSHKRATEYFIESINSFCSFASFKCSSWEDFLNGDCLSYNNGGFSYLGYYSNDFKTLGSFYNVLDEQRPYCKNQYLFELKINSASSKSKGEIFLDLYQNSEGGGGEETIKITE